MGIKYFFKWIKNNFSSALTPMKNEKLSQPIDVLLIDLNGIFHSSAQKIFKYGEYKEENLLFLKPKLETYNVLQEKVFVSVCEKIQNTLEIVCPKKKLVLCTDGPAPIAKQRQQRARRFARAMESENEKTLFDSNAITPGTKFMDYLGRYIDFYIRKKISEKDVHWKDIEVIFSNEKVPGEGEHKLLNFFRKYGNKNETYCVFGMDADLIMLCLSTNHPNFYVLREEQYEPNVNFYFININEIRKSLISKLNWNLTEEKEEIKSKFSFVDNQGINDFILMCFCVGNDFLPHIPGIEINENALEIMFEIYKKIGNLYGHLSNYEFQLNPSILKKFFKLLSTHEQKIFDKKILEAEYYFENPILKKNSVVVDNVPTVNIKSYKKEYYTTKFDSYSEEKVCFSYIEGLQWVLSYYTKGISNWKWYYPYNYAPFASTLAKHCSSFKQPIYETTHPTLPFIQLLSVLPPKSNRLIPAPLCGLIAHGGLLKKYCPNKFEIDIDGMRQKWEGVVIIPSIDYEEVEKFYKQFLDYVSEADLRRNKISKSYVYRYSNSGYAFNSFYGNFDCHTSTDVIDL